MKIPLQEIVKQVKHSLEADEFQDERFSDKDPISHRCL